MQRSLPDELLREAAELYTIHGTDKAAAKHATDQYTGEKGISRSAFQHRRDKASSLGYLGTEPVLPGFRIKQTSAQTGPDGELQREWVTQVPDSREEFEVPDGHAIKGISALVGPDGRVVSKWVKTHQYDTQAVIDAIKTEFGEYAGQAKIIRAPRGCDKSLLTVYPIADLHLGMFAWAQETGQDYDVKIAEELLTNAMTSLVSRSPNSEEAIILNLGDFVHADNNLARTQRGNNALDVDTRYAKVLQIGVALLIRCVELAAQKHNKVTVRCLPGNHDEHTALFLGIALSQFFSRTSRVTVDLDPSLFFWHRHGKCLIGATHGHTIKPESFPGIMASRRPEDWGSTKFRFGYLGHVHHRSKGGDERDGCVWETFQTLAPKDAWAQGMGYNAGRSMTAITLCKERGEIGRNFEPVIEDE